MYDHENIVTTAGDVRYATAAGVETRLAIGTIGHIFSVAAGGTTPEWRAETALSSKLLSHTRDMTAASGDVAYTGYGFQPSSLIVLAGLATGATGASIGFGDVNLSEMSITYVGVAAAFTTDTAKLINLEESTGSKEQYAVLKTLDADGFTLTWTKVGTTTAGTATLIVLALR